jgi:hypothetical protein
MSAGYLSADELQALRVAAEAAYGWDCGGTLVRTALTRDSYAKDGVQPVALYAIDPATILRLIAMAQRAAPAAAQPRSEQEHADLRLAWKLVQDAGQQDAADRIFALLQQGKAQSAPVGLDDTARLDFVIKADAFLAWKVFDSTIKRCQLMTQDEDENFHVLSGPDDRYFATEREAIDAAILAANKGGV